MLLRSTQSLLLAACMSLSAVAAEPPPRVTDPVPVITPPPAARDGRVDLRPKFEVGQVVRYTMKQVSDQVVPNQADPKDPNKTHLEQTVGLKMTTKALDSATGEATVEIVYETVKAKLDSPQAVVDFDSTRPAPGGVKKSEDPLDAIDEMVADQFRKLVGTTMTMKIARDGRINSVTGGESLSPTLIPGVAQVWGDAMRQLGGLFRPISTNSTQGFDGTARVGTRWTHSDSLSVGPLGGLDMITTYDLRSFDRASKLAKVYFSGSAEKKSSGEPTLVGVDACRYTGQYAWDARLGQLVRCEMEHKTTMSGPLTQGKPATSISTLVLERSGTR